MREPRSLTTISPTEMSPFWSGDIRAANAAAVPLQAGCCDSERCQRSWALVELLEPGTLELEALAPWVAFLGSASMSRPLCCSIFLFVNWLSSLERLSVNRVGAPSISKSVQLFPSVSRFSSYCLYQAPLPLPLPLSKGPSLFDLNRQYRGLILLKLY